MRPTKDDHTMTLDPEAPPRRRASRWAWLVLAVALIAAAAGAVLTGIRVEDRRHEQDQQRRALAAGRAAAVAFTSYDYRHLHRDLRRVQDMATGTFRTQFTSALTALTKGITTAHGVSVGTVVDAGLVTHTDDDAVVVAAVDAAVTNTSTTAGSPSTRRYRLQITLNRDSGTWLISDIAPVG